MSRSTQKQPREHNDYSINDASVNHLVRYAQRKTRSATRVVIRVEVIMDGESYARFVHKGANMRRYHRASGSIGGK